MARTTSMPASPTELADLLTPTSATPSGRQSPTSSRKETILSLVEMLLQESEKSGRSKAQTPSFEDDRDVPSVDEHLQVAGAEAFHKFQRIVNTLDKELRNFANAARQLGSSVAILSSAFHLRERIAQILYLYHENAADLFPRKIAHVVRETSSLDFQTHGRRRRKARRMNGKAHLHVPRPTVAENLDPEDFPDQLEALAREVGTFLNCLNEFPEFTDEAVNASILSFEGDLKYWSSCLREYSGQFRYAAVQRYIHDLSSEMGDHIAGITSSLCMFIEVGVPTIRFAQKHGSNNLLNLSTIATFFSAVTATTMQFSYGLDRGVASDAVNSFWFASLVFSIGAAVNSLLGLTWKQAMYRSPGHRVPWWVLIWIKRSPLVFLVLSVACFSIGLCAFTYASNQSHVTATITTVLTAFTSFGLAAVSAWFASERWAFSRHRGQKWLSDVLTETVEDFSRLRSISWINACCRTLGHTIADFYRSILQAFSCLADFCCTKRGSGHEDEDLEANGVAPMTKENHPLSPESNPRSSSVTSPTLNDISRSSLVPPTPANSPTETTAPNIPNSPSEGKQLWKNAMRTVKMRSLVATAATSSTSVIQARSPVRQRTISSATSGFVDRKRTTLVEPIALVKSRLSSLAPKLVTLEATQDLAAHTALVRDLQFSPDGKYLATSSWDRTSVIFRVGDPFVSHRILAHTHGFVGQVAWSPKGNFLLTKLARGAKVWAAEDGVCTKTINRNAVVESLTWMPDGQAFLSVEDSTVTKLNLKGKVLDQYDFGRIKLHDVAVTPDSLRLLGIGPLLESPTGLQPSKSRVEKRLVVYNILTKQIESQTPLLNDVRDITLAQNARSGLIALISYEHKAPPQLWKIELVKDRDNNSIITARLTLRHTYMPKTPVDFAGPSYFGGINNELVLCAGKAGDIHIWDQESGALLHQIRAQAHGGDLTCLAWNHAADDPFMFVTGSHDGAVRVWTRLPDDSDPSHPTDRERLLPRSPYRYGDARTHSPEPDEDDVSLHSTQASIRGRLRNFRTRALSYSSDSSRGQ